MGDSDQTREEGALGKSIDVKTAIWIVTTLALVSGTYFATRTGLEGRISANELYRAEQGQIDLALKTGKIYEQINALRLIELELSSLRVQVLNTPERDFIFGTIEDVPNFLPEVWPPDAIFAEILIQFSDGSTEPYTPFEATQLLSASFSPEIRALDDTSLVSDIYKLGLTVSKYNRAFLYAENLFPNQSIFGIPNISLSRIPARSIGIGAPRKGADDWRAVAMPALREMKAILNTQIVVRISEKREVLTRLVEL